MVIETVGHTMQLCLQLVKYPVQLVKYPDFHCAKEKVRFKKNEVHVVTRHKISSL